MKAYWTGLKYNVFPCFLVFTLPAASNLRSLSLVFRSFSPTSSAISATGIQGSTDLNLIAIMNSLSVCLDFPAIKSLIRIIQFKYICFMLHATKYVKYIYNTFHTTYMEVE